MASIEIKTTLSTAADGRTRDLRYRQNHFISLHQWIINHLADIETAICKDDHASEHEARFMVSQALQELEKYYNELDLQKSLEEEYRVKNGRNNDDGRAPEAVVYIIPDKFTLFYSALCALCACIAAGSCCIVELSTDLTHSINITRQCLSESLDRASFTFTSTRPSIENLSHCLIVDQTGKLATTTSNRVLRSQPQSWAVVLVDRTADLEQAAKEIFLSRTFFSGKGPYAPSCILVNEFVEQDLVILLQKQISKCQGNKTIAEMNAISPGFHSAQENSSEVSSQDRLIDTEILTLVKIHDRRGLNVHSAQAAKTIPLLAISSHDDGIDTLNNYNHDSLLALYVFAAPHAAKYMTQFVRSKVSFINHIPANLLVGPAAPVDYAVSPIGRYRREMMESPSPKFVTKLEGEIALQEVAQKDSKMGQTIYNRSLRPLKPTGQPKEGDGNFFEQGMLTGLILLVLPLVTGTLFGTSYLTLKLYRRWR